MDRKFKKVAKGIYLVGNTVFFRQMVDGKREMEKAPMQGLLAIDQRGAPTKELKRAYQNWAVGRINEKWEVQNSPERIPTFAELIAAYEQAAADERIKNDGRPKERTVANTKKAFKQLVAGCGFELTERYTKLDREAIEGYFVKAVKNGMKRVSAWSYVMSAKAITARWALPYYERHGMRVASIAIPAIKNRKGCRYERPSDETRRKVMEWYAKLWELEDKRLWLGATLMLQFAMRNSDARAAKWEWFVERRKEAESEEKEIYLRYVPEKTKNSSARHVMWPVHEEIWRKMQEARAAIEEDGKGEGTILPGGSYVYVQLNASLRDAVPGMKDCGKACYELRKLRIDAEYRKNGAERASALSGDNINTITYYYADVADVAAAPARAEDLIE